MNEKDILEEDKYEDGEAIESPEAPAYMCTVVSLLPYALIEDKPMMLPNTFAIPAASIDGKRLGILHVGEGVHYIPNPLMDEGKPGSSIRQVTIPSEMARSICEDYNCAHVALGEDASPGLFWVPGKLTEKQIHQFHSKRLASVRQRQKNWFHNLCIMADADWEKNHDMRAVSDLQRLAARSLGVNKAWVEFKMEEMALCPYCHSRVSPEASICSNCREIINPSKHAALKKQFDPSELFGKEA